MRREDLSRFRRKNINFCQKFKPKTNCELRKCRSSSKEEIIINYYTSVKEIEPTFEKKEKKCSFVSVAFVNNEAQLYDVVNITGFVYNVSPIEIFEKNEQQISLRKASLKDHTDEISITFFENLAEKVEEQTTFSLTDLRVSKYMNTRLLKTAKTSQLRSRKKYVSTPKILLIPIRQK